MAITKVTTLSPSAPDVGDWQALLDHVNGLIVGMSQAYPVEGTNIASGAVFNIGGALFKAVSTTAISTANAPNSSKYIRLVVSGDSVTPYYLASFAGIAWNSIYGGYYNAGGDLIIFDEVQAMIDGVVTSAKTPIGKIFQSNGTLAPARIPQNLVGKNAQFWGNIDPANPPEGTYVEITALKNGDTIIPKGFYVGTMSAFGNIQVWDGSTWQGGRGPQTYSVYATGKPVMLLSDGVNYRLSAGDEFNVTMYVRKLA